MSRREERDMVAAHLAELRDRVEKLRAHTARPDYSGLDDDELRLLTELSRKAHGDPNLIGVDLVAPDRPGHGVGGSRFAEMAEQPFKADRLNPRERIEFERLVAKIRTLPP